MASEIELEDLSNRRAPGTPAIVDDRPGGRINLDANQEQAVTLWAYAATTMCVSLRDTRLFTATDMCYQLASTRYTYDILPKFLAIHIRDHNRASERADATGIIPLA